MTEDGQGQVQFRTSKGHYLSVDSQGSCVEGGVPSADCGATSFQLLRISIEEEQECETDKGLWILRSPQGAFLSLDPVSKELQASQTPVFWQADSQYQLTLTCVRDTPTRRQHYRQMWAKQTVQYVKAMMERYLQFNLGQLSLKEALQRMKSFPAFPFRMDVASRRISLRTLCVSDISVVLESCLPMAH